MGDCIIECGTCGNWYHTSCETVRVDSKDWKCKTCSDSGTLDMLQDMEELGIKGIPDELSMSSNKGDAKWSSWKTLVNYAGLEYKNSCQAIDVNR